MSSTFAARCVREPRHPVCFAGRTGCATRPALIRGGRLGRKKGRHPATQWRLPSLSLTPPPELELLANSAFLETVDPTMPHTDTDAQVWYVPHFLDEDSLAVVAKLCAKLRANKKMKPDFSVARGRRSAMVPVSDLAYSVFAGQAVVDLIKTVSKCSVLRCGDYPIEARLYLPGSNMEWHQDVQLYEQPQLELVFTVDNESDAHTQWVGSDGVVRQITPSKNSALLVTANGAWHRVVEATTGERTIVKALYCPDPTLKKTAAFAELLQEAPWRR
jgi:hypothetical protein